MKKYYSVMILFAIMVTALSFTACDGSDDDEDDRGGTSSSEFTSITSRRNNVHLGAKMNILKSAETPLFMGVSVDFSFVEAITHAHLPQNRAVFEYFSIV